MGTARPGAYRRTLVKVKRRVDAMRGTWPALVELATEVAKDDGCRGVLALVDSSITPQRLGEEWRGFAGALRDDVGERMAVWQEREGVWSVVAGNGEDGDVAAIEAEFRTKHGQPSTGGRRADFGFIVTKLLAEQSWRTGEAVKVGWLMQTAGCSHQTVADAIALWGGFIERTTDRRVRLTHVPREIVERLRMRGPMARQTMRFADRSGRATGGEVYSRRLAALAGGGAGVPSFAFSGVAGVREWYPAIDLVGSPRVDVCVHGKDAGDCERLMQRLDPALRREDDLRAPADVAVHWLRQAEVEFRQAGGVKVADPVECLLDLYEMRLDAQAEAFLGFMMNGGLRSA